MVEFGSNRGDTIYFLSRWALIMAELAEVVCRLLQKSSPLELSETISPSSRCCLMLLIPEEEESIAGMHGSKPLPSRRIVRRRWVERGDVASLSAPHKAIFAQGTGLFFRIPSASLPFNIICGESVWRSGVILVKCPLRKAENGRRTLQPSVDRCAITENTQEYVCLSFEVSGNSSSVMQAWNASALVRYSRCSGHDRN